MLFKNGFLEILSVYCAVQTDVSPVRKDFLKKSVEFRNNIWAWLAL